MTLDRAVVDGVRARLVDQGDTPTTRSVVAALRENGRVLDSDRLQQLVGQLRSDLAGLGPLDRFRTMPDVTDILVNGCDGVWIDRGNGLERTDVHFPDDAAVLRLVRRLVNAAGRRIDDAHPYADVQLPGAIRLHAVLPPVVERVCVSLRTARPVAFTLPELVASRTVAPQIADALSELVGSRLAFVVSGGTGSGKTTILSSLLGMVDRASRIVLVEDTRELNPSHQHVIRLQSRAANIEGQGAISLRDLVRQALRMRPDRLVVGEARGAEMVDLLAALNTGHEGGCGTLHANTARDVPARVEALVAVGGLDRGAAHSQLASALDAVVHLARRIDGTRYVASIDTLEAGSGGLVSTRTAWCCDAAGTVTTGTGLDRWLELVGRRVP
ncbi:MAG TPA: TadA family conjugal transfer-associated ATPase [Actinomycetes bacterium]|nr:TadA family conjugal transfer-associated ATPase [Actinomycetes bacterium]